MSGRRQTVVDHPGSPRSPNVRNQRSLRAPSAPTSRPTWAINSLWSRGALSRGWRPPPHLKIKKDSPDSPGGARWRHLSRRPTAVFVWKILVMTVATTVVATFLCMSSWILGGVLKMADRIINKNLQLEEHAWLLDRWREVVVADEDSTLQVRGLWDPPETGGWRPCLDRGSPATASDAPAPLGFTGYYQIFCQGGLNQMHICICNAVVIAKLLNATLVLPELEFSQVWKDPSGFADIFDLPHFLAELSGHVSIVTELPEGLRWSTRDFYRTLGGCRRRPNCVGHAPKHAPAEWYIENLLPRLQKFGVALNTPTSHRLTFDGLSPDLTKLRCLVAFRALRFAEPLRRLALTLAARLRAFSELRDLPNLPPPGSVGAAPVSPSWGLRHGEIVERPRRVRARAGALGWLWARIGGALIWRGSSDAGASATGDATGGSAGRYVALHLRFEIDMLAHSKCEYVMGWYDQWVLKSTRQLFWRNKVPNAKVAGVSQAWQLRAAGRCPLTPEEAGLLLAGLGYPRSTVVYIASYGTFGGEERLRPLRRLFPRLIDKSVLMTEEEIAPLRPFANRLAAIDAILSLESDVFMSNAAGNLPNVVSGLRTIQVPPRRSIHANKSAVAATLVNSSLSWVEFSDAMRSVHEGHMGGPVRRAPKYSVYRYPAPDCMCQEEGGASSKTGS